MTAPSQTERVLNALRKAGPRGITAVDFALPDVIDGGPPIMRVAARVMDLRRQGHTIIASGRRQKCQAYELVVPAPPADLAYAAAAETAFEAPARPGPRCAIFDDWEDT